MTQPDFHLDDFEVILEVVKNAIELTESSIDIAKLTLLLSQGVKSNSGKLDIEEILMQSQKDVAFGIESNESEPVYLFRDEFGRGLDDYISGQIIQKGLQFLDDIMPALPLAHTIKGTISTKNKKTKQRSAMTAPVDVESFKRQLYNDPDNIPQMYSLGIGYVLNMHQAWVPDGFALGSLLYSLILAPGEEQRLIVREKTESYTIQDDAMGIDMASEAYSAAQVDDTVATYNYAVDQLSLANSSSKYSTKTSSFGGGLGIGGLFNGISAMLGLSGSHSKSSGSASSSARQSNTHREASSSAQGFQHQIKSASERVAQSKRISVRTATSEESSSVATKIIANHNHSHAMTIQYWEVMRQYRIESCIAGIDLVLFVPLRLIKFLPTGESYDYNKSITSFNKKRSMTVMEHCCDMPTR